MDKEINEATIQSVIESGIDFEVSKERIITQLIEKYGLTESEAIAKYDMYAPVIK